MPMTSLQRSLKARFSQKVEKEEQSFKKGIVKENSSWCYRCVIELKLRR